MLTYASCCQVRWDTTGLVGLYNTGRHDEYTLLLWSTDVQVC
jgi:hypothetical protein